MRIWLFENSRGFSEPEALLPGPEHHYEKQKRYNKNRKPYAKIAALLRLGGADLGEGGTH